MNLDDKVLTFSATDLSTYSSCSHATLLDREVARGNRKKPHRSDPAIQLLQERGSQHEAAYRKLLEERSGKPALDLGARGLKTRQQWQADTERTRAAMKEGHPVIFQAAMADDHWHGYVDFLVRRDHESGAPRSSLGDFHYAAVDTKLAQEARGSAILQLCVYSIILESLQGMIPDEMTVVSPAGMTVSAPPALPQEHVFRTADFGAYFRRLRRQMELFATERNLEESYPEPCSHCDVCSWWDDCNTRRRSDDHLSFVAGISRPQRKLLAAAGVDTLESLGKLSLPMVGRPKKLAEDSLERIQHQARLQLEARQSGAPQFELLPAEPGRGLSLLPEPTAGDIFFDIEADRYAPEGTLHYLFGWEEQDASGRPVYTKVWAHDRKSERAAFERFVDHVQKRRQDYPAMHVYHFAPFEKTALGQMSLRYLSREDEVDDLMRNAVLTDLMPVVKQSLRAGVESYSIKEMEQFYGYVRETDLRAASRARRLYEINRETGEAQSIPEVMDTVANYNREDCESTLYLRDWLEAQREKLNLNGAGIVRPASKAEEAPKDRSEWVKRVEDIRIRLLKDMPEDLSPLPRTEREGWSARKLLADLIDWHARESKPAWWEYFRTISLSPDEAVDDSSPIGGIGPAQDLGKIEGKGKQKHRYQYAFPDQEYSLKKGDSLVYSPDGTSENVISVGEVADIDRANNLIIVERTPKPLAATPLALAKKVSDPPNGKLQQALAEIAESLAPNFGLPDRLIDEWDSGDRDFGAARALLSRAAPLLSDGSVLQKPGETSTQAMKRVGPLLSGAVLPVQGPPGAGKTYSGSDMIVELVRAGKKVGITAQSHKVIANLLEGVHAAVARSASPVQLMSGQKVGDAADLYEHVANANLAGKNGSVVSKLLRQGELDVVAGTAWLWTDEAMRKSVDVLVIDEAGQFSLANALAVSVAADSLVLLGDPQQLGQPLKGTHPAGAEASALEHLLEGAATVAEGKGLFLESTWRLPPQVAEFTSSYFYGGRLKAHPDCAQRELRTSGDAAKYSGAGMFFVPVEHEGNVNHSEEEAEAILEIVQSLFAGDSRWVNRTGEEKPLQQSEVLIVAPYNSQVHLLEESLIEAGFSQVRVGTVDKFQGQEAPVVIYSMTTSRPEDAPRGLDFLYSLNRLNVTTSRSEAIVLVVSSPRLLEADCKTPGQMRLVNGLCGAAEMAVAVASSSKRR